jgi:four helix bundle protein
VKQVQLKEIIMRSYRELIVWQTAMDLAVEIYDVSKAFPREELYGLTSQIRRSAVSIPSNIAEGNARETTRDYLRHLSITRGSLAEMETQTILSNRLGFLPEEDAASLLSRADEISRMLRGLQNQLKRRL